MQASWLAVCQLTLRSHARAYLNALLGIADRSLAIFSSESACASLLKDWQIM